MRGCSVTLIGKDVQSLMDRIFRPRHYLRRRWRNEELLIWLAVLPNAQSTDRPEQDFVLQSAFIPAMDEDPKELVVAHSSPHATHDDGISWFSTPRANDQSLRIMQYLTRHRMVGEREVRLVPHPDSFRYVFSFGEYSSRVWPALVTGTWEYGQSRKTPPQLTTAFVHLHTNEYRVEAATSSDTQERDQLGQTSGDDIQMKFETPYMEEYSMRAPLSISIPLSRSSRFVPK